LNKTDKIIIIFYILLAVSYTVYIFDTNSSLDISKLPDFLPKPITELEITRDIDIPTEVFFRIITDVSTYPLVLPQNMQSVVIKSQNDNVIIAEETMIEKGLKTTLVVKHTIIPYETHTIEVLEGDAKGTKIVQTFESIPNGTRIKTNIYFDLKEILYPLLFLPQSNFEHAINTILKSFVQYAKISQDSNAKTVDDVYREILFRPADATGLQHYSKLLKDGDITEDDLRELLLNSNEKKSTLNPLEILSLDKLSPETIDIINKLYLKFLVRSADPTGLQYYGTLLESGKLSIDEIEKNIFNSDEALKVRLGNDPILIKIDELHMEIFNEHASSPVLDKFNSLIIDNKINFDDLKEEFLSQK
jgi:ribosome-associated toxin RatA of RatAB toxin-antitoxin module